MPTLTVIKHFDVIKNIAAGFFPRSVDLFLYPLAFHQSPDSVDSALLPAVPQIQMDLAITVDASRFQPELFNLSCQSQVCLMAL
ncbi:hypothetical protein LFZ45_10250 [Salmonella enterica subsp. enterica serovar Weslaco str. 247K]|nr:hypothetical protein LFZ45_10250 [Salmonella enterica subsp. enterica serovar Weslaco str. 247K]VEA10768.1 Uncharacterised protein [Salmonella enterica subsp. enterica]